MECKIITEPGRMNKLQYPAGPPGHKNSFMAFRPWSCFLSDGHSSLNFTVSRTDGRFFGTPSGRRRDAA